MCVLISLNAQYLSKDMGQPPTNILMLMHLPVRAKLLFCSDSLQMFSFQRLLFIFKTGCWCLKPKDQNKWLCHKPNSNIYMKTILMSILGRRDKQTSDHQSSCPAGYPKEAACGGVVRSRTWLTQVVVPQLSLNVSRGCLLFFTVLIPGFLHRERDKDRERERKIYLLA